MHILLLEDCALDAELIVRAIRREYSHAAIERVGTRAAFAEALEGGPRTVEDALARSVPVEAAAPESLPEDPSAGPGSAPECRFDIVVSDYALPGFDGFEALDMVRARWRQVPFVFVSGVAGEEIAIESLRRGATDYVLKQRLERLPTVLARALSEARERAERQRAEEHQRLLVAELSHRVKNTLATVVAIARRTLQGSTTLEQFEGLFMGRVLALSEAHGLLFKTNWEAAPIEEIAQRIVQLLQPEVTSQVEMSGPPVALNPRSTLSVSLVLHELAVNAARHGALSGSEGRVRLSWTVAEADDGRTVSIEWRESGGPKVEAPARSGFGLRLIERSVDYELGGKVGIHFDEAGLRCQMAFPHRGPGQAPLDLAGPGARLVDPQIRRVTRGTGRAVN